MEEMIRLYCQKTSSERRTGRQGRFVLSVRNFWIMQDFEVRKCPVYERKDILRKL